MTHAFDCKLGGYRTIQHNEVRDLLATCLREAGHASTEIEPQTKTTKPEVMWNALSFGEHRDMTWTKLCSQTPKSLFAQAENMKIREYGERIPVSFSAEEDRRENSGETKRSLFQSYRMVTMPIWICSLAHEFDVFARNQETEAIHWHEHQIGSQWCQNGGLI